MAEPVLIAAIVIGIIATILIVISVIISAIVGNRSTNPSRQQTLWAASGLTGISIAVIITSMILGSILITNRKRGKKSRGLNIAFIITFSLLIIMAVIALIIEFVVANQLSSEGDEENARNLRAAGALLIISLVLFAVGFVLIVVRGRSLLKLEGVKKDIKNK